MLLAGGVAGVIAADDDLPVQFHLEREAALSRPERSVVLAGAARPRTEQAFELLPRRALGPRRQNTQQHQAKNRTRPHLSSVAYDVRLRRSVSARRCSRISDDRGERSQAASRHDIVKSPYWSLAMSEGPFLRPLIWVGPSREDFRDFPEPVQDRMGYALYVAQRGEKHRDSKPLSGFGGAGV